MLYAENAICEPSGAIERSGRLVSIDSFSCIRHRILNAWASLSDVTQRLQEHTLAETGPIGQPVTFWGRTQALAQPALET